MKNIAKLISIFSSICLGVILIFGCSSQKDTGINRGLQNLSARYNYIYNANILLETYQQDLDRTKRDNYDNFLAVYNAPLNIDYLNAGATATELESITSKAQAIIAEKNLSNYLDEAYMLLGKSNFYAGNYFNATAYFDYAAKAYKNNKNTYLTALNWKAKSLMQLNNYTDAIKTLDTVKIILDSVKNNKAEPLVTLAQMSIYKYDYKTAITYLETAIKETNKIQSRTRWPYILAQLYEHEKDYNLSLRNYTKVENSNAPFEMYFNAKLSKIRINDALNEVTTDRKKQLLKLLKDDKNLDYTDQIYYEVAEDYFADNNFEEAFKYYKLSAQKSTINPNQKGLSYLKIAELNFKELKNYVDAKLYYDSAITTLPKNYPNYESIVKKGENLAYLTQRYEIISAQDTLQAIANLNEQDRAKKLDSMFEPKKELPILTVDKNGKSINKVSINQSPRQANGTFYFNNLNAISKGFSDFRKVWGNRPLEDDWRLSLKSSRQIVQQNQTAALEVNRDGVDSTKNNLVIDKAAAIKNYISKLPLTPDQLTESNLKIIDSYFEIAGFYQQVLNEQQEAIKIYELLLERFPENKHLETIYYSLYLGYKDLDEAKATLYKNIVLNKYRNSVFAKTILDPNFSIKQNALELELNKVYNTIFATYTEKDFSKVINDVDAINQRFPNNNIQAQFDYLKAIAIGRTENVAKLLAAFNNIIVQYPNDELITPLIKDHIAYINTHLQTFEARPIALIDFDPFETPFTSNQTVRKKAVNTSPTISTNKEIIKTVQNPVKTTVIAPVVIAPEVKNEPGKPVKDNFFSIAESNTYYFVIAVSDISLSVSSSRFGIGQFNRGNYAEEDLKHQLNELNEDQLIYIGEFENLTDVKSYAEIITNQLPKIMKVPTNAYKSFYISKENYIKLKNKETINRYLEFFKNNY